MSDFTLTNNTTVSVIGLGYIGLPCAAIIAQHKINVLGIDSNQSVIDTLNNGKIHIVEKGLEALVKGAIDDGYLKASNKPETADVFIIAVPTPFHVDSSGKKLPDISYIESALASIAPCLQDGNLIIIESTIPVGTTENICNQLKLLRPDLTMPSMGCNDSSIYIAHCPERVLPGKIIEELVNNDRIIGGISPQCTNKAIEFYNLFVKGKCIGTDSKTAELAKLTENAYRDVNIAFANELSLISEHLDIDVNELISLTNHHPRVNVLQPGPGVGGHCIAVDPWFIVSSAPQQAQLIHKAREINDYKPVHIVNKVTSIASEMHNPAIACLGLSYKPDIDDLRESPALQITHQLATNLTNGNTATVIAVEIGRAHV